MTQGKRLIVNADDLGYDPEIDRGILEAHRRGIVTSASAMVNTEFAAEALASAPRSLGVGLHAVLESALGTQAAERHLLMQIEAFGRLRGIPPTHLDSHKHAHRNPAVLAAFARVAAFNNLPVRALDAEMRSFLRASGVRTTDHFLGDAALRPCWTAEKLAVTIGALPDGITELMAHPGHAPIRAKTSFAAEREEELAALCDPAVRAAIGEGVVLLASFSDLA